MKTSTLWYYRIMVPVVVVVPLLGFFAAVYAFWNAGVDAADLWLLAGMYVVTGLGLNLGFHRMMAHHAFEAPAPVRFILLALGTMTVEGPALDWAAIHAKHHARGDREGDPHSPMEGFLHAHLGWLFRGRYDVEAEYYAPYRSDAVVRFVSSTFLVWVAVGILVPFWIGGWSGLVWGGLVRVFVGHHAIWSVNSICHTFGRRPFETNDTARNNWLVTVFALGEGWHNNHHAFPSVAYHGFRWWQLDPTGYVIRMLAALRLVRHVQPVPAAQRLVRRRWAPAHTANA